MTDRHNDLNTSSGSVERWRMVRTALKITVTVNRKVAGSIQAGVTGIFH